MLDDVTGLRKNFSLNRTQSDLYSYNRPLRSNSFHHNNSLSTGSSHGSSYPYGGNRISPTRSSRNLSNNSIMNSLHSQNQKSFRKPKLCSTNSSFDPLGSSSHSTRSTGSFQHSYKKPLMPPKTQYLALDCEMVACGVERVAARVVLIDWKGRTVLDEYMKPKAKVTDYLTFVSGITAEQLENAEDFEVVQKRVKEMLENKILVGHGVDNDLRALGIEHPWLYTRDTAYYQPFMRLIETSTRNNPNISQTPVWGPRKLKDLALEKLQRDIQVPGKSHCPVEDAQAALDLYKSHRPRWEACMSNEEKRQRQQELQMAAAQYAYAYEQGLYQQELCETPQRAPSFYGEIAISGDMNQGATLQTGYQPTISLGAGNHNSKSYHNSLDTRSYHNPTPPRSYGNNMGLDTRSYHVHRQSSFSSGFRPQHQSSGDAFVSSQPTTGHSQLQCQRSMDNYYNYSDNNNNNHNNAAVY